MSKAQIEAELKANLGLRKIIWLPGIKDKGTTDADGRKLVVHTMPPPLNVRSNQYTRDNPDFAPGYINYLPINGAVIAPQFGDAAADQYCKDLLTQLYPGRVVVQLNIDPIAAGGGGIHCVSKQLPLV
ncbi:Agmatine deiminase [compost metagenome]